MHGGGSGGDDCCNDCDITSTVAARPGRVAGLAAFLVSILLFALSWDTLEPTEFGLVANSITGRVDLDPKNVYEGGRHFIWLAHHFLVFPKNRVTIEFSDSHGEGFFQRPPLSLRTGSNHDDDGSAGDTESGGQPLDISVSFQYNLIKERIPEFYQKFGMAYEDSFARYAQDALFTVATSKTPREFWEDRGGVERQMHAAVNHSIRHNGFANVAQLQLLRVGFLSQYEETITNIQLQEQLKVTKGYQLEVTRVLKQTDILESETTATIMRIDAEAAKEATVIKATANAAALQYEQETKALWYRRLKAHMGWDNANLLQYVKMKSLNAQPASTMVVGVSPVGS
jgi:hypothetical protein